MLVPCECRCGCNLFLIFVIHQVNGNDDTYEFVCSGCGKEYGLGVMVIQENDDVSEN
jgi:hypothetical protein